MADEVGKGNFDISAVPVESSDEIGVVTKAFNKMVASIQEYIEKMRQSAETERILKEKELTPKIFWNLKYLYKECAFDWKNPGIRS